MALRLEIISRHRQSMAERGIKEFGTNGGTIGRSLESDWVLPDGQRYVSSRHASIDFRSGSYYIVDTSTNGVYVNESDQPVGRGKPQRLFDGDRLRIGEYQIKVHIEEQDGGLTDSRHVDPVDLAQRVAPPDPTGKDMVSAFEVTGVGFEELISEEDASGFRRGAEKRAASLRLEEEVPTSAAATPAPARPSAPQAARSRGATSAPAGAERAAVSNVAHDSSAGPAIGAALEAFFRGAGMRAKPLGEKDGQQLLHRLGQLMREMIVGLMENLHLRAEQKSALRLSQTTIQPQDNNPLKFSASVDEALDNLFFRDASEYLPAVDAVREAFGDVRTHQQILLNAVMVALLDYMGRIDPEELEEKFARGAKRNALIGAANKLKYWDLYKDLYQVMVQHAPGQFPPAFLEELSHSYEQAASRLGRGPQDKPKTAAS
jgi:type VI secretion system FHA domain protein